jgi:hypothetical protein
VTDEWLHRQTPALTGGLPGYPVLLQHLRRERAFPSCLFAVAEYHLSVPLYSSNELPVQPRRATSSSPPLRRKPKAMHTLSPQKKARTRKHQPRPMIPENNELMPILRDVLTAKGSCDRDMLIQHTARKLRCKRISSGIRVQLSNAIRTAKRRGILFEDEGMLDVDFTPLNRWDRDMLKDQFLAAINQHGRVWFKRREAIQHFARWLGFRRAGALIEAKARALINGLIRDGRLEKEDDAIRRV